MTPRAFKIHPADNVATMLDDVTAGGSAVTLVGEHETTEVAATGPIASGHKIALRELCRDEPVIKFGIQIGVASSPIRAGDWVHLHNVTSAFDERSATLDVQTGAVTDTKYE